jgi:hypothetical protein
MGHLRSVFYENWEAIAQQLCAIASPPHKSVARSELFKASVQELDATLAT